MSTSNQKESARVLSVQTGDQLTGDPAGRKMNNRGNNYGRVQMPSHCDAKFKQK